MATANGFAAFISYAHRYQEWVEALHHNLEHGLAHAGRKERVFLDKVDLGTGRSWVAQLQAGLDQARHLILVVTPEAVASPRVMDEQEAFISRYSDWGQGRLHVIFLVDTPLPPYLAKVQYLDFRRYDADLYNRLLAKLLGGLLERAPRDVPQLPQAVQVPNPPESTLPGELRAKLVAWLAPVLQTRGFRLMVSAVLKFESNLLEVHPSFDCAASAAVVLATRDDDPLTAALRITDTLIEGLEEDLPEQVTALRVLRAELAAARPSEVEEPGLLGAWLDKVVKDHEKLVPYFQQRAELDLLERVFVQLDLRAEQRPRVESDAASHRDRPWTVRELLALEPEEYPWVTRRWVVLGDPGAGKTTLLRHLAATVARERPSPWVPIFAALPRLMRQGEYFLDLIERQMKRAGHAADGLATVLHRAGQEGRLLLLLDGLDEVPREERDEAEALLRQLAGRWPGAPVVVTSRPIGYHRPDNDFQELELLPLDGSRRRELLARWFGRAHDQPDTVRAEQAAVTLERDASLRELASNPLYLTLMALLIEKGTDPDRHRTGLYDQVFSLLLAGEHRPEKQPIDCPDGVRHLLSHLALAMTRDNLDAEALAKIETRLYQPDMDALRAPLERVVRWRTSLRPFLDDVAEKTGILGPHDGPDTEWRFWHRTFREALAAEALEREGEVGAIEHARQIIGDEGRWAEPYALLAGRVKDPDTLVRELVKVNRPLGVRAVATAQGLRDETLWEILALNKRWQDRVKVYPRILDLVGDPLRALALLDQLRQRTRNGNDLFFLEKTVAAVGRESEVHQRDAAEIRERFYDHIPPPAAELFRSVDTPLNGRIGLWREIPAGSFQMGSSPEEENGVKNERPQHEVVVASPFLLAAVPVTQSQYLAFDPSHSIYSAGLEPTDMKEHPVNSVTWYEAMAFCSWLAKYFPGARLPTEEEWEYACRAGTKMPYWSGRMESNLAKVGWYDNNSSGRTHRVGGKPANAWGLYDVHGNVWEWMLNGWSAHYLGRRNVVTIDPLRIDPADFVETDNTGRVTRGGSSFFGAHWARSAYRYFGFPEDGVGDRGFRVLLPRLPSFKVRP